MKNDNWQNAADFMPTAKSAQHTLQMRAEQLKTKPVLVKDKMNEVKYVQFDLQDQGSYGLPYENVLEVISENKPVAIPKTPAFVAGLVNYRGLLMTVFDLSALFHFVQPINSQHLIVVDSNQFICGLLVNYIVGSDAYNPEQLQNGFHVKQAIPAEFVIGLHRGTVTILNPQAIVAECLKSLSQTK